MDLATLGRTIASLASRADGWENAILGLGGQKDPSAYTRYSARAQLTDETLEALYVEDHFAAKIVEALPQHGLRAGWDLAVPGDPKRAADLREWYRAREDELEVAAELAQGAVWGRLFGGALTWIGADDGRQSGAPLDETNISTIRFFHTFDRRDVQVWRYYSDPLSPKFRQPEIYRVQPLVMTGAGGGFVDPRIVGGVLVHESRCVRWGGQRSTDRRRQELAGWDDSVLERCWDALKQLAEDYGAKTMTLGRISQAVYKIKGLYAMIAGKQEATLRARMGLLDQSRSRARAILLDADGEAFEAVQQSLSGLPETLNASVLRVASAADMPVTIFMGQAPAGMDATGESDLEIWDGNVEAWRALELRSRHERITRLLLRSKDAPTGGEEPDRWSIKYRPLRVPSAKERGETGKLVAETDAINIERGIYSAEAAAFRYAGDGAEVVLDENELRKRLERRKALADQPPKDNAELGTIAPRNEAVLAVIAQVNTKQISRDSGLAILVKLHRFTDADARDLLGPENFAPAPPPSDPTPGPAPAPQAGQGAGAPQPTP